MIRRRIAPAACRLVALAGAAAGVGLLLAAGPSDDLVRLDQCPPPVRATILAHLHGGTLVEIERTTDHGRVLFEVDVRTADGILEFDVAQEGEFVGYEDDDPEEPDEEEHEAQEADDHDEDALNHAAPAQERDVLIPHPIAEGATFSPLITHPYLPLSEVRWTELRSDDERIVREVLDETRAIGGVECLILAEHEYEGDDLVEISYNYFAQDADGNVYYFGEDVDDYENGRVVGHGGAWLVGRNATEPCLFLPADLEQGLTYKPENSPPAAEEWAMIGTADARLELDDTDFQDVLVILESDRADRWEERKYYARGLGLISENRSLNLVEVRPPTHAVPANP